MSLKPFYLIGGAAVAIAAAAAVTVFAADTPATKPPAAAPAARTAPPAKGERKIVMRMEGPSFAEIDANHDGSISQAEFDAFHAAHKPDGREPGRDGMRPGMMAQGRGFGAWGGPPPMMRMNRRFGGHDEGMGGMEMHGERALDLLDSNSDGKLSFDEMVAPLKRHFDRMDTNHDGALSGDELKNGHGKDERQMPPPPQGQ